MKHALWTSALLIIILAVCAGGFLMRGHADSDKQGALQISEAVRNNAEVLRAEEARKATETPRDAETVRSSAHHRQLLETIGALTAAHYFQTYLNIGFIADGKAKGTYTEKDARKVLDTVLKLLDTVDRKLDALSKSDLEKSDRESLEQLWALSTLLRQQGEQLQASWASGKEDDAARYEDARKDSWAVISKVMGIR